MPAGTPTGLPLLNTPNPKPQTILKNKAMQILYWFNTIPYFVYEADLFG